jgi:putative ABC transport system ATP-binding protein
MCCSFDEIKIVKKCMQLVYDFKNYVMRLIEMESLCMLFDRYELCARVIPSAFVIIPPVISCYLWFPQIQTIYSVVIGVVILILIVMPMSQYVRDEGRRKQKVLYERWGGVPTTAKFRCLDKSIDSISKKRYKKCLENSIDGSGTTQVKALNGVSFSVKRGEFVAIVGASGSGKSTLLHMIGGVDRPTAGKVLIEDTDIYKLDKTNLAIFRRRQVGLIYQFYNLLPILNVEENITLPLLLDGQKADQKFLKEVLETLNLADRAGHLPNELSGGEQQRVSIGRALINRPALVLADEPTGNLDSKNSQEIVDLLKLSNKRYHQTLLMVTHNHNIALMADRMITISDGRIVKDEVIRR